MPVMINSEFLSKHFRKHLNSPEKLVALLPDVEYRARVLAQVTKFVAINDEAGEAGKALPFLVMENGSVELLGSKTVCIPDQKLKVRSAYFSPYPPPLFFFILSDILTILDHKYDSRSPITQRFLSMLVNNMCFF